MGNSSPISHRSRYVLYVPQPSPYSVLFPIAPACVTGYGPCLRSNTSHQLLTLLACLLPKIQNMTNNSLLNNKHMELPKLTDNGLNNNYGEWKSKSFHIMHGLNLWQYIEGPSLIPPAISSLILPQSLHGTNDGGKVSTIYTRGNQAEYDAALAAAKPWMDCNYFRLSKVISATPSLHLHLVEMEEYAKEAWENLRKFFQPHNSLRASTIQTNIQGYHCQSHMNIFQWLHDLQHMYRNLCTVNPEATSDCKFAILILNNIVQDDSWRTFLSNLSKEVCDTDLKVPPGPIASIDFAMALCEEYWYCTCHNPLTNAHIFSTCADTDKCRTKCACTSSNNTSLPKRARNNKSCSNSHCGAPHSHDISECIAYSGRSQGKYTEWWRSPWNIHLPPNQCNKTNNIPPETHPAYAKFKQPSAKVSAVRYSHNTSRSNVSNDISSPNDEPIISLAVANETPVYS